MDRAARRNAEEVTMLQIVSLTLGSFDRILSYDEVAAAEFTFPRPVAHVHAVLRGFRLEFADSDHELSEINIRPVVRFDPSRSKTTGTVTVQYTWRDADPTPTASDTIRAEVHVLLMGSDE
jgi:hypothetical protein